MNKKTVGIIGPGKHFKEKIYPILIKSNFFNIQGILRRKKIGFEKIKYLNEKEFFKKKFDFVYISCPNKQHENYILKSLIMGSHVICEKPFILRKKKINKIINLAKRKKRLIFEAFMYIYHPVFKYVEKTIKENKYGRLRYAISNFRYPSLKKSNNRYKKAEGGGFFYDAASYVISLENFLFDKKDNKKKVYKQKIKKSVDLKGNIFIRSEKGNRFYFWGEGQNYSNNLELFFNEATIHIDKFFSKSKNEIIKASIFTSRKKEKIFDNTNQFEKMFYEVQKNYQKKSFQRFHSMKIKKQLDLMVNYSI